MKVLVSLKLFTYVLIIKVCCAYLVRNETQRNNLLPPLGNKEVINYGRPVGIPKNYTKNSEENFKRCMFTQTAKKVEELVVKLIEKRYKEISQIIGNNTRNNSFIKPTHNLTTNKFNNQFSANQNKIFKQQNPNQQRFTSKPQQKQKRQAFNEPQDTNSWDKCVSQSELQQYKFLENEHILSIRQELEKLKELVALLRDQQYVLNILSEFNLKPHHKMDDSEDQKQLIGLLYSLTSNLPHQDIESKTNTNINQNPEHKINSESRIENPIEPNAKPSTEKINEAGTTLIHLSNEIKELKQLVEARNRQEGDKQKYEEKLLIELKNQWNKLENLQQRLDSLKKSQTSTNLNLPAASKTEKISTSKMRISDSEDHAGTIQEELRKLDDKIAEYLLKNRTFYFDTNEENSFDLLGAPPPKIPIKALGKKHESLLRKANDESEPDDVDLDKFLNILHEKQPRIKNPRNRHLEIANLQKQLQKLKTGKEKSILQMNPKTRADNDEFFENLQRLLLDSSNPNAELKENPFDLNTNTNSDLQTRLDDLENQLKVSAKIRKLEKNIKQLQDSSEAQSKSNDDEEEIKNQLKKIQNHLTKLEQNNAQGKNLDDEDDIDRELKNLQDAINNLRPKEDTGSFDSNQAKDGAANFQVMLNRLLNNQVAIPSAPTSVSHHLNPAQIQVLRRLMQMRYGGTNQHLGGFPAHGQSSGLYGYQGGSYGQYGSVGPYGGGSGGNLYGSGLYGNHLPYSSSGGHGNYGGGYGSHGAIGGLYGSGTNLDYGNKYQPYSGYGAPSGGGYGYSSNPYNGPNGYSTSAGTYGYGLPSSLYNSYGTYAPKSGLAPYSSSGSYGSGRGQYGHNGAQYGSSGGSYGSSSGPYGSDSGYGGNAGTYGRGLGQYGSGGAYGSSSGAYGNSGGQYGTNSGQYGGSSGYYGSGSSLYGSNTGHFGNDGGSYGTGSSQYGANGGLYKPNAGLYGVSSNQYGGGGLYGNSDSSGHYGNGGGPYGNGVGQYDGSGPYGGQYGSSGRPYVNSGESYGNVGAYGTSGPYGNLINPYNGQYGVGNQQYGGYEASYGNNGPYTTNSKPYGSNNKPYGDGSGQYLPQTGPSPYGKQYDAKNYAGESIYGSPNKGLYGSPNKQQSYEAGGSGYDISVADSGNSYAKPSTSYGAPKDNKVYDNLAHGYEKQPSNYFFPSYQGSSYQKGPGANYQPTANTDAGGATQSYGNPQQNSGASGSYAQQKVGDLKTQIYSLQNVINNLNRPEYVQKPEDQETIANLDKKISDLKNIVNHLSQDMPYANVNYDPNSANLDSGPNYQQPYSEYQTTQAKQELSGEPGSDYGATYDVNSGAAANEYPPASARSRRIRQISEENRQNEINNKFQKSVTHKKIPQQFKHLMDILNIVMQNITKNGFENVNHAKIKPKINYKQLLVIYQTLRDFFQNNESDPISYQHKRHKRDNPNPNNGANKDNKAMNNFFEELNAIWEVLTYFSQSLSHNKTTDKSTLENQDVEKKDSGFSPKSLSQLSETANPEESLTRKLVQRFKREKLNNAKPQNKLSFTIDQVLNYLGELFNTIKHVTQQSFSKSDNQNEILKSRVPRQASLSTNMILKLFEQLAGLINMVNELAEKVLNSNCGCLKDHKPNTTNIDEGLKIEDLKRLLSQQDALISSKRRKRQVEESDEDDEDVTEVWNKMASFFKNIADEEKSDTLKSKLKPHLLNHGQRQNNFQARESKFEDHRQKLQNKLEELKHQLDTKLGKNSNQKSALPGLHQGAQRTSVSEPRSSYYQGGYYQQPNNYYYPQPTYYQQPSYDYDYDEGKEKKTKIKIKKKKDDVFDKIFAKILDKILDKVIASIPTVIRRLLSLGLDNILGYGDYGYGKDGYGKGDYGSDGYGVQKDYKFGIFSIIPMLIYKVLSAISGFVGYLQKNRFIKTFLVPALVTVGIAGLVVFLIWWLSGNDQYGYDSYDKIGYNNNYGYSNSYGSSYRASDDDNNNQSSNNNTAFHETDYFNDNNVRSSHNDNNNNIRNRYLNKNRSNKPHGIDNFKFLDRNNPFFR